APPISGHLTVPGLQAHVEVVRDRWGIPHIYAQSEDDLFFAQGYVHAQDRLWQMDLCRRAALGTLAEVFGERALAADRAAREAGGELVKQVIVNYGDVVLASTGTDSCPADVNDRATLVIDSGSDSNTTVTVRMRRIWVGKCARLVITGSGKVDLWLLEPATDPADLARQALKTEQLSIFGSTTTGATPSPIGGDRFTVNVLSSKPIGDAGDCFGGVSSCAAVHFNQAGLISGTFVIPNGGFELDQAQLTNGAILAKRIQFDRNTTFTWDPRSKIGQQVWSQFNRLRAWKDQ
ncbi:MAG: penicillin acylase family protein, partial [Chloroflexi bacterium]|nr:penicillin acylase family protein [Chloroflexota bacterium]